MIKPISGWLSSWNGRGRMALLALAAVAGTAGAVAGAIAGLTSSPFDVPFGSGGQAADPRQDVPPITVVQAADPAMRFPDGLQSLPGLSYDLVVDSTGGLWWVQFGGMEPEGSAPGQYDPYTGQADKTVESALVRYDPDTGQTENHAIPASGVGTPLMSSLAMDGRGHVVWAEHNLVVDFDPGTGKYQSYTLGDAQFAHVFVKEDGSWITDMAVMGNTAYISRANVAAITAIDLEAGKIGEMPYPASFGQVDGLAAGLDSIWLTASYDMPGQWIAGTGWLDPATGEFTVEKEQPTAYAEAPDGSATFAVVPSTGVVQRRKGPESFEPLSSSLADRIRATGDEPWFDFGGDKLAVDPSGEAVWVASNQIDQILRVSLAGDVEAFNLPVTMNWAGFPCGSPDLCDDPRLKELHFVVRGLAVAPNGDVYFGDGYRIGVITPPK